MQTYNVFYLVSGDEENQNISDTATLSFDAEDLDGLFAILRGGEEDGSIQSELGTIAVEGDIRIECILIYALMAKKYFVNTIVSDNNKCV